MPFEGKYCMAAPGAVIIYNAARRDSRTLFDYSENLAARLRWGGGGGERDRPDRVSSRALAGVFRLDRLILERRDRGISLERCKAN